MRPWDVPREWPPDAGYELASLLSGFRSFTRRRGQVEHHPNLKDLFDELDGWLNDNRSYDERSRAKEWASLLWDVQEAAGWRGPKLRSCSPTLDHLLSQMAATSGKDSAAKKHCLTTSAVARKELAEAAAALAAFDDLVTALLASDTSYDSVQHLLQMLEAALRFANGTLSSKAILLAGIADNAAWSVAFARHDLDGAPLPDHDLERDEDAGLSLDERIDLSRRILAQETSPGHHVVWVAYDRARLKFPAWRLEVGPVTFFDGPTLLRLFKTMAKNARQGLATPEACSSHGRPPELPEELRGEDAEELRSESNWPKDVEFWVAARIDLGAHRYADPVRVGRAQADALVGLAGFNNGRSTWRPLLSGHLHVVDGFLRSSSGPYRDSVEFSVPEADFTDEGLDELRANLVDRLPIDDPSLQELIDAAGVLNDDSSDDATALLQDVRTIELLATRCGTTVRVHLNDFLALLRAHNKIIDEIQTAVHAIVDDTDLRFSGNMVQLEDLRQRLTTYDGGGRGGASIHLDVAVAAIPKLAVDLPEHHLSSRRIRTVAARIRDTAAITQWVNEVVHEYAHFVERLLRCRNSLVHGGPVNLEVIASVQPFSHREARFTTALGLQGFLMAAISVKEAHELRRNLNERWRSALPSAASIFEALFGQPPPPDPGETHDSQA